MNKLIGITALMIVSQVWASTGEDKALQRAEKLHQQSCTTCHKPDIYTRKNRTVNSLDGLVFKVKQCEVPARTRWTEQEADWVVQYLNKEFYKF